MPVGKVYNAAENQVLFSPVSNYYQGKAIRLALKNDELAAEIKEKQLEQADDKFDLETRRVESQEKQVKLQEEALDQAILENEQKVGKEIAEEQALDLWYAVQEVDKAFADAGKTEEAQVQALELAEKRLAEITNKLPDGEQKTKNLEMLKDGITAEEYRGIQFGAGRGAIRYGFEEAEKDGSYTLAEGAQRFSEDNELVAENVKDASASDLKAADESFILKMVGQHFGGIFNEDTQQINFLDPSKQRKASQISALASNLFAEGVAKSRSDAVKKAMKAYGEKWEEPEGSKPKVFDIAAAAKELNVTVEDLQFTASKRGMSAEEVYNAAKSQ
jgi:hypothetical protein